MTQHTLKERFILNHLHKMLKITLFNLEMSLNMDRIGLVDQLTISRPNTYQGTEAMSLILRLRICTGSHMHNQQLKLSIKNMLREFLFQLMRDFRLLTKLITIRITLGESRINLSQLILRIMSMLLNSKMQSNISLIICYRF